jgi:hypothetical protein
MQRFYVTPVLDGGRQYFMANFPAERKPWSRKAAGRKQKKFSKREAAEAFLEEAKREWVRKGGVKLGFDREAHYDFMRAMEVIADIPKGTLEKAALVYRMCVSTKELRGNGYEASLERKVELSPRLYLGCVNEAKRRGVSVREAAEGMLASWLEAEAVRQIGERVRDEAREYKELVQRNEKTKRMLAQIEEEDRLMELMGKHSRAYEDGRNSILMERNRYQREWRRKRREREAKEQSNGNGSSDLQ